MRDRQRERKIERHRQREREAEIERKSERQTEKDRERHRQTQREGAYPTNNLKICGKIFRSRISILKELHMYFIKCQPIWI